MAFDKPVGTKAIKCGMEMLRGLRIRTLDRVDSHTFAEPEREDQPFDHVVARRDLFPVPGWRPALEQGVTIAGNVRSVCPAVQP